MTWQQVTALGLIVGGILCGLLIIHQPALFAALLLLGLIVGAFAWLVWFVTHV